MTTRKTWFITGCDSGMGKAIAETVLEHDDRVVVTVLDRNNVADLAQRFPNTAHVFQLNVTQPAQVREVVAGAEHAVGPIDVLVNNAGHGLLGAVEETAPEEYPEVFEINFFGLVEVTRAVLPGMRKRGRGHIINTSSSSGYSALPGSAFYGASKFAVEGFSESLAQEVAGFGLKVTILEPGSARTKFAGASMKRARLAMPEYQQGPVEAMRQRMAARDGTQPNDPKRVAKALIKVVQEPSPPLRLPLGEDAINHVEKKAAAAAAEFRQWRPLAVSVGVRRAWQP